MHSYSVSFLGSTENAERGRDALLEYAKKCRAVNWKRRKVKVNVWSLASSVRTQRALGSELPVDEIKARHEKMGYRFLPTRAEALAAGRQLAAMCEDIADEVYGKETRGRGRR